MTAPPRYFVHLMAEDPGAARESVEVHGRVVSLVLYQSPSGQHVYGSAEVEPAQQGGDR